MHLCADYHGLRVSPRSSRLTYMCTQTVDPYSNDINAVSFSHDGEFIAIANNGNYIDIVSFCDFIQLQSQILTDGDTVCYRNGYANASRTLSRSVTDCYLASLKIYHRLLRSDEAR